jgi:predicted transcriptional regulator of viral defense system
LGFPQKGGVVPGSIPHRVLAIVNPEPDRIFEVKEFESLGQLQSVRTSLHRMAESGLIEKVDRGKYRAVNHKGG